jgi:hypothetical protein
MNDNPSFRDRLQNQKMIHIPMHDCRQTQLLQLAKVEAQRSAGEVHLARHLNQGPECDPLQRHRMATPERVQVDAVAVIRANHSQAGEPAFSCFGLPHNREIAPAAEIQEAHNGHIMTLEQGSRIDVISWSGIV